MAELTTFKSFLQFTKPLLLKIEVLINPNDQMPPPIDSISVKEIIAEFDP